MKRQQKRIIHYDSKSDVLYIGLKKGEEEEYREVAPGISVELDKNGAVIGIEVLRASEVFRPVASSLADREASAKMAYAV